MELGAKVVARRRTDTGLTYDFEVWRTANPDKKLPVSIDVEKGTSKQDAVDLLLAKMRDRFIASSHLFSEEEEVVIPDG